MIITHDALNFTVQGPLLTSVGQVWRPVQTFSLEDPLPPRLLVLKTCSLEEPLHLVAIEETGTVGANGWYPSYWNAFLLEM